MIDNNIDTSFLGKLKRLFSTDVIIRNVGGTQLKVVDISQTQSVANLQSNSSTGRFSRIYSGLSASQNNTTNNYKYNRVNIYNDYEVMDTDAIISAALDILADECTLKNEMDEVLSIQSPDENIQRILYNLFYDILNIEYNLWAWTRDMCKYGDAFLHLHIKDKFGVYNVTPFQPYDVAREENFDPENPHLVQFRIEAGAAMNYSGMSAQLSANKNNDSNLFQNYEVAHFRLLSNSSYLPYGRCVSFDTQVYTETGIKEIRYINVKDRVWTFNIEENKYEIADVLATINSGVKKLYKISTNNKEIKVTDNHPMLTWNFEYEKPQYKQVKDLQVGDYLCTYKRVDTQSKEALFNFEPTEEEYDLINPNYNVGLFEIKSIVEELPDETYDIQVSKNSNFIANGIIVHNSYLEPARKIHKQLCLMEEAMLIHRIMRAPEKRVFYHDVGSLAPDDIPSYMEQAANKIKKVPYVDNDGNYNLKYNMMNINEDFHIPTRNGNSGTKIDTLKGLEYNAIEDVNYLRDKELAALKIPKAYFGYEKDLCVSPDTLVPLTDGRILSVGDLIKEYDKGIKNHVYSLNEADSNIVESEIEWAGYTRLDTRVIRVSLNNGKYIDCTPDHLFLTRNGEWKEALTLNYNESLMSVNSSLLTTPEESYRVVKMEELEDNIDTCDLTISKHHNFSTDAGVIIHNSGKSTLASEDVRFAHTIERLQKIILSELVKIALIHLHIQGYEGDQVTNFELSLTTPSIIYEQERIAVFREKVGAINDALDTGMFSKDYLYEEVLKYSEDKINDIKHQTVEDGKHKFRITQIENEGNDPYESGKSYGTPHDLASLYGSGRMGQGVPEGYDENSPEPGRPTEHSSTYGTQASAFGNDPLGNKGVNPESGKKADYNISTLSEAKKLYEQNKHLLEDYTKNKVNIFKDSSNQ